MVNTDKEPNISKTNYTEDEIKNNFKIEKYNLNEVIDIIKANMPNHEKNKLISPSMISAIEEYLERLNR